MGQVKKQSIQNSLIQYVGIALGYFNSVILFTNILDLEQMGLTRVLFAIAGLYINLSLLGSPKILIRFFPFLKTIDKSHQGFLIFNVLLASVGFLLVTVIYLSLQNTIVEYFGGSSTQLFIDNYHYVILVSVLMLYTSILEHFLMAMKKTVLTYFLKNIFIRFIWIGEILLFHFGWIDFDTFILLYAGSYIVNFLIMFFYLLRLGEIKINLEFLKWRPRLLKIILNYGLFSILSGISSLLVNRIDIIMITFFLGLSSTSVYSIAAYISAVIFVPSQAIYRISMPLVADYWKNKDLDQMKILYQKSSINQLLIGGFVFLCIWMNIDDLFKVMRPEYSNGKWVVLILSLSILFNMMTGINNVILVITKYFRYDTIASISLAVITIITNLLFIPIYGMEGAAIATLISVVSYHSFKFILIMNKLKMQPFTLNTIWAVLVIVVTYLLTSLLPEFDIHFLLNIALKCFIISVIYLGILWRTGISEDIQIELQRQFKRISI